VDLLDRAEKAGVRGARIESETFDELMGDLAQQVEDLAAELLGTLNKIRSTVSNVAIASPSKGWPIVRMNAVPILRWPKECRKFEANIGGAKQVRELLRAASAQLVAVRSKHGVLAFGGDAEVRRVFAAHEPDRLDLHSIEVGRLWRETNELHLLRSALVHGLVEAAPLLAWARRGVHEIRVDDSAPGTSRLMPLCTKLKTVSGTIPGTGVKWAEAVLVRVGYRLGRLWMLLEPTVWFGKTASEDERYACGAFVRERQARRYNRIADEILTAWLQTLLPGQGDVEVRAFDNHPGIEARFVLSRRTAFARRSS
jgi:hypothetical protein